MRAVGRTVADTLRVMAAEVRPGMTTAELDAIGERHARRAGARSAPQLAYDFPGFNCISVNEEIVHGIPGARVVRPGDVVKLDVTLELGGYIADSATTVLVAPVSLEARALRRCARLAFRQGLLAARAGNRVYEISRAIASETRRSGFAVLRGLSGHGVGRRIHEEPSVPNEPEPPVRHLLTDGLVLAVEPMISARPASVVEEADGWTLRTHNRAIAVHHEHTIVVRQGRAEVLTAA
jgi:methionyl aminopeptidase